MHGRCPPEDLGNHGRNVVKGSEKNSRRARSGVFDPTHGWASAPVAEVVALSARRPAIWAQRFWSMTAAISSYEMEDWMAMESVIDCEIKSTGQQWQTVMGRKHGEEKEKVGDGSVYISFACPRSVVH
ncbi:MAG: hypothetical protein Q9179_003974 [Wetmoreana sp. 5 TL-2023]